jgi:hypothetical protein
MNIQNADSTIQNIDISTDRLLRLMFIPSYLSPPIGEPN